MMMRNRTIGKRMLALLAAVLMLLCSANVLADELNGDDSLQSLGILTEGVSVDPDFYYSTLEYNVLVPAGTEELVVDPTPSSDSAHVSDISGTMIDEDDGTTTVSITVVAENGASSTYSLYVTSEDGGAALRAAAAAQTETESEAATETETETETEDSRYVSVARDTLEEAESTIDALKDETSLYRERVNLLMKILYALIALSVVLLFIVINLILRNRDIRSELSEYQGLDYSADQSAKESLDKKSGKKKKKKKDKKKKKQNQKQANKEELQIDKADAVDLSDAGMNDAYEDTDDGYDLSGGADIGEGDSYENEPEGPLDDPNAVPKPTDARTQERPMPQYETPKQNPPYEPPKGKDSDGDDGDVKVDFIDL